MEHTPTQAEQAKFEARVLESFEARRQAQIAAEGPVRFHGIPWGLPPAKPGIFSTHKEAAWVFSLAILSCSLVLLALCILHEVRS